MSTPPRRVYEAHGQEAMAMLCVLVYNACDADLLYGVGFGVEPRTIVSYQLLASILYLSARLHVFQGRACQLKSLLGFQSSSFDPPAYINLHCISAA